MRRHRTILDDSFVDRISNKIGPMNNLESIVKKFKFKLLDTS